MSSWISLARLLYVKKELLALFNELRGCISLFDTRRTGRLREQVLDLAVVLAPTSEEKVLSCAFQVLALRQLGISQLAHSHETFSRRLFRQLGDFRDLLELNSMLVQFHAHSEREDASVTESSRVAAHASATAINDLLYYGEAKADSMGVFLGCAIQLAKLREQVRQVFGCDACACVLDFHYESSIHLVVAGPDVDVTVLREFQCVSN